MAAADEHKRHREKTPENILFPCSTMATRLLLLLWLTIHVFAKEPPDVDCLVIHLKYVHCSWKHQGTPEVNYTFYSWFQTAVWNVMFADHNVIRSERQVEENLEKWKSALEKGGEKVPGGGRASECAAYLWENSTIVGCNQPYRETTDRFNTFYTRLAHGNSSVVNNVHLKKRVKLFPPTNLTVQIEADSNLWFYWNQTASNCVEHEVLYRINNKKWDTSRVSTERQSFCINLPSASSVYELKVRSKIVEHCGGSLFWSDWSKPVVWGSNNSTDPNQRNGSVSAWTPVLYVLAILTLIILVLMLLRHERVRIILLPVVPKPSLNSADVQAWRQLSKGLKENFNYNERACPVSEYGHVSQSDSESSDSATSSVTSAQTGFSLLIPMESDLSTPCSSSTSSVHISPEEAEQLSV
ncbi:cytokine receptor common subunit gamma-like [Brachionichthys hirsutus]|uniref:cytokine receptor common subunit gamma-like n=1 Tax=Brachionichthys hirsutus TaxID=412623 RepID=UPI00360532AF